MSKLMSCVLVAAALSLLLSMNAAPAAVLARQCGAVGIVTYDLPPARGYEAWAAVAGSAPRHADGMRIPLDLERASSGKIRAHETQSRPRRTDKGRF